MAIYIILSTIVFLCCLLLAVCVLAQNPKGGGLNQTFGGVATQAMGARKAADFLEKATWTLAISLCVLSIFASFSITRGVGEAGIRTELTVDESLMTLPQLPTFPMPTQPTE